MIALSYSEGFGPSVAFRFASRMTSDGRAFLLPPWRTATERGTAPCFVAGGGGIGTGRGSSRTTDRGGSSSTGWACT